MPHAADQPFWGGRVAVIGVGPRPIPVNRLTAENFEVARIQAESSAFRIKAAEMGKLIRAEDGAGAAVALIQRYAAGFNQKTRLV